MPPADSVSDPVPLHTLTRHRTKLVAGLLALCLGWAGGQSWYLGRASARWQTLCALILLAVSQTFFDARWENPAFLALFVAAGAGFIDGLRLCLMADEVFDARYNPDLPARAHMGWPVVLLAAATLLIGAVVTLWGIAMTTLYVWTALGWLDGYQI